jgi:hypothetical protein
VGKGSVYDEGLVAAACGLPAESNPYSHGSGFRDTWRRGFLSYGVERGARGVIEIAVRRCVYVQDEDMPGRLCPWAWCEIHGIAEY